MVLRILENQLENSISKIELLEVIFFFKKRNTVAMVKLPIIILESITHKGGIVVNETFSAANAEPHMTTKRRRRMNGNKLNKVFCIIVSVLEI